MQESGPTSPGDEGLKKDPAASEGRETGSSSAESGSSTAPAPVRARTSDPVIRWLMLAIFAVVILWLAGMLGAVMFGLFNPSGAPRTSAERNISYYESLVQTGKASTQTVSLYIDTLIQAGQLSKAQSALDQALKTVKKDKSYLLAEQAQLLFAKKDYQGTVTAGDKAMAEAQNELKAAMAANVANNRAPNAGATLADSYSTAALAKANALVASNDYGAAIKAYDAYLIARPLDSDILVARATAKVQVGDKVGAAADYRAALKYIPDYQPALDGLKKIGAAK